MKPVSLKILIFVFGFLCLPFSLNASGLSSGHKYLLLLQADCTRTDTCKADELYTAALEEYKSDNLPLAFNNLLERAEKGHLDAGFRVAEMYFDGKGVKQDIQEAIRWYIDCAYRNHAGAQEKLGDIFWLGIGVVGDVNEALYWYKLAAENNDVSAQRKIGDAYYEGGDEIQVSKTKALSWYLKGAAGGDLKAQKHLAFMYFEGIGTPINKPMALYWTSKAAKYGDPISQYELALKYYYGEGTKADRQQAAYWIRQAIENENTMALKASQQVWNNLELSNYLKP